MKAGSAAGQGVVSDLQLNNVVGSALAAFRAAANEAEGSPCANQQGVGRSYWAYKRIIVFLLR